MRASAISVGASTYGINGETLDQLLIAADQAMYSASQIINSAVAPNSWRLRYGAGHGKLTSTAIN